MVRKVVVLLVVSFLLAGCAVKRPQMSREEWLETTSRDYQGVTKEQSLAAAEKLLRLTDGDDFRIMHTEEGIYAVRNWIVYIVFAGANGVDYWSIKSTPTESGVRMSVQVNTQMSTVAPVATMAGDWSASSSSMGGAPVEGTAVYDLFWARMDYLLNKNAVWTTCDIANKKVKDNLVWGSNEQLCNSFNVKDSPPDA